MKWYIKATGGGGSEVNFEILRYVVELDLNFQMLLSLPKTSFLFEDIAR